MMGISLIVLHVYVVSVCVRTLYGAVTIANSINDVFLFPLLKRMKIPRNKVSQSHRRKETCKTTKMVDMVPSIES